MDYTILIPDQMSYFLNGFQKTTYPTCFADYCRIAAPFFESITDPEQAAAELVDWIDAHPGKFFRKRRVADRQMLMLQYTAPAAVQAGKGDFAYALSRAWSNRHPDFPFRVGTYEVLLSGFNTTLLGFPIHKEEE